MNTRMKVRRTSITEDSTDVRNLDDSRKGRLNSHFDAGLFPLMQIKSNRLEQVLREFDERLGDLEMGLRRGLGLTAEGEGEGGGGAQAKGKNPWAMLEKKAAPKLEIEDLVDRSKWQLHLPEREPDANPDKNIWLLNKQVQEIAAALNTMNSEIKHKAALQEATDKAQDEMMRMEFDGMRREIGRCLTKYEAEEQAQAQDDRVTVLEGQVNSKLVNKIRRTEDRVDTSISKVVKQVAGLMASLDDLSRVNDQRLATFQHTLKTDVIQTLIREKRVFGHQMGSFDEDGDDDGGDFFSDGDGGRSSMGGGGGGGGGGGFGSGNPFSGLRKKMGTLQNQLDTLRNEFDRTDDQVKNDRIALNGMQTSLELLATGIEANVMGKVDVQLASFKEYTGETLEALKESSKEIKMGLKHDMAVMKQETDRALSAGDKKMEEKTTDLRRKIETEVIRRVTSCEEQVHHMNTHIVNEMKTNVVKMEADIHSLQEQTEMVVTEALAGLRLQTAELRAAGDGTRAELDRRARALGDALQEFKEAAEAQLTDLSGGAELLRRDLAGVVARSKGDSDRLNALVDDLEARTQGSLDALNESGEEQKKNFEGWMDRMGLVLAGHQDTVGEAVRRVERSNVALAVLVRRFEQELAATINKDRRWDGLEAQWQSYVRALGDQGALFESKAAPGKAVQMSPQLSRFLIQMGWRVGKMIGLKSDFEISKECLVHAKPEDEEWDYKVVASRQSLQNRFLNDVAKYLRKKSPNADMLVEEARNIFLKKVEMCVKLTLSKFKQLQIGATLFGRVKLEQACAACDRPFHHGVAAGGNPAAAESSNDAKPKGPSKRKVAAQPRHGSNVGADDASDAGSLGEAGSLDTTSFMPPQAAVGTMDFGGAGGSRVTPYGTSKGKQKFVYRGGFKIPKKLQEPKLGLDFGQDDLTATGATKLHTQSTGVLPDGGVLDSGDIDAMSDVIDNISLNSYGSGQQPRASLDSATMAAAAEQARQGAGTDEDAAAVAAAIRRGRAATSRPARRGREGAPPRAASNNRTMPERSQTAQGVNFSLPNI